MHNQHVSAIVFCNSDSGCMLLLWSIVPLVQVYRSSWMLGFFLTQFEQQDLPKYLNLHKHCFVLVHSLVIPSYKTELSCISSTSSLQQSLHSVGCSFSSLRSFPISPADSSAQALSPGFTVSLSSHTVWHGATLALGNLNKMNPNTAGVVYIYQRPTC